MQQRTYCRVGGGLLLDGAGLCVGLCVGLPSAKRRG